MSGRGVGAGALITAALLLVPPAGALADHDDADLPWPQALPARTDVPTDVQPRPVPNCGRATIACIDDLLRRLRRQWRPLDASCDHRALFSLAYIRITAGLRESLAGTAPPAIRYPRWLTYVITTFSNRYFQAFGDYAAGRPVPDAWRITFDAAREGDANGGQDVLLASNAHTQRDLPHVYAEQGTRTPDGASRKPDHDAVNAINSRVFDGLEDEFAERYDPFFTWIDAKPSPLDELGTMEMVKGWREGAWRNGERLLAARSEEERQRVSDSIELGARLWAELIASGRMPGHRATRDAHCESLR
jgi:Family of unknown function (DUF5995)